MKIQSTQDLGSAFQEGKTFHPLYEDSMQCDLAKIGLGHGLGLLPLGLGLEAPVSGRRSTKTFQRSATNHFQ